MIGTQMALVEDLFEAALEIPRDTRSAFLFQACASDIALRMEIEALLAADACAGSFLEVAPVAGILSINSDFSLEPGDIVSQRFRIVRELGAGGMGRVYEAYDSELSSRVALKALRPEIARAPELLQRFRQEVRIAHRITHPNVCRSFHLDHDIRPRGRGTSEVVSLTFITMEYLPGETLQQAIRRRGAFPVEEALPIALQVAEGLAAAHRAAIVHRDIKPSNVMLCPQLPDQAEVGRVVVTDFGLAKSGATTSTGDLTSISQPGLVLGTLNYMAPEQLTGGPITPATDVYAFGLVLFELTTGTKAFPDCSSLPEALHRLSQSAPSPRATLPELPMRWDAAISRCLSLDPNRRFQNALDVIAAIEGRTPAISNKPRSRLTTLIRKQDRGALWGKATLAVGVASALALLIWRMGLYQQTSGARVSPGAKVYLTQTRNHTEELAMDSLTELLRAGLSQSVQVNLIDQRQVGDTLQQMTKPPASPIDPSLAREIAMRTGAARVIFSSLTKENGEYHLDLDMQQPDSSPQRYRHHWTRSFSWRDSTGIGKDETVSPELLGAIRDASDWIRKEAGESANDIARLGVPPEDVTTANWGALQDFTTAQRLLASGLKDPAIRMLESATVKDPRFALAFAQMADNLMSESREEESFAAYTKAIAFEQEGRLTARERYFIVGSHASDTGDYKVAVDAFKSYTDLYPNDFLGWYYLAYPLLAMDRPEDALFALKNALKFSSGSGGNVKQIMALSAIVAGRLDDARRFTREVELVGDKSAAAYTASLEDFLAGQYDAAEAELRSLQQAKDPMYQVFGYSVLADLMGERGRWDEALQVLDRGVTQSRVDGEQGNRSKFLLDKASILCRLQRFDECFAVFDEAQAGALTPAHLIPASWVLGIAARSSSPRIRSKSISRLKVLLLWAHRQPDDTLMRISKHRLEGELQSAKGDWKSAVEEFRAAERLDPPVADRAYFARALASAADHDKDAHLAAALREQARSVYARTIERPAFVWYTPWMYSPGLYGDDLQDDLELCGMHGAQVSACHSRAATYQTMRGRLL